MTTTIICVSNVLKILRKSVISPVVTNKFQKKCFSAKPPNQSFVATSKHGEEAQKKSKRLPIPKITLISGNDITVTTLEEAQKLSKRRDLKLVKITDLDTKSSRPVFKLMTGTEYHAEDLKQRELKKKLKANTFIKGEKVLMLSSSITPHDLETKVNTIQKWLDKRYEVKVAISGEPEKNENIYNFLEDKVQNGRFLQKRSKGSDLKCQIIPPKPSKEDSNNL